VPRSWADGKLNTFGFTREDYDPVTGLLFLRARYYKPDIGRSLTQDEDVEALTDPLAWNLYIYCRNNPVTLVDPSGKVPAILVALAIILLSGVAAGVVSVAVYLAVTPRELWSLNEALFHFGIGFIGGVVAGAVGSAVAGIALKTVAHAGAITKVLVGIASGGLGGMAGGAISQMAFNFFTGRPLVEGLVDSIVWGGAMGALFGGITSALSLKFSFFRMRPGTFLPKFKLMQLSGQIGPNTWKFIRQQVLSSSSPYYYQRYKGEVVAKAYSPKIPIGVL